VRLGYTVRDWPGKVYRRCREEANPEFENTGGNGSLLRQIESGFRQVIPVGDETYKDQKGKAVRTSAVNRLLENGFVVAAETAPDLLVTERGRRNLAHLEGIPE
jgi:hypothetical protein